ncbi:hypothetical protein ACTFIU_002354 [Dictyostelium citrinum]
MAQLWKHLAKRLKNGSTSIKYIHLFLFQTVSDNFIFRGLSKFVNREINTNVTIRLKFKYQDVVLKNHSFMVKEFFLIFPSIKHQESTFTQIKLNNSFVNVFS